MGREKYFDEFPKIVEIRNKIWYNKLNEQYFVLKNIMEENNKCKNK